MSKLTKNQKAFLKTIKNDKARAEQKTQFKLQNKFKSKQFQLSIATQIRQEAFDKKLDELGWIKCDTSKSTMRHEPINWGKRWKEKLLEMDKIIDESELKEKTKEESKSDFDTMQWGDRKEPQIITKEALRDLTEPKTKPVSIENVLKGFIEHCESRLNHNISLIECRDLKNSCIKQNQWELGVGFRDKELKMLIEISREVLLDMVKCGEIDATTLFKVESEKLKLDLELKKEIDLLFPKPEGERINLEKLVKTAQVEQSEKNIKWSPNELDKEDLQKSSDMKTTDTPKEFCVEITKDNQEVLLKVQIFKCPENPYLFERKYMFTNSLFTKLWYADLIIGKAKVVSTEEFLTYIGKEDLIERKGTKISDLPQTIIPKDNDYVVEPNIFDRQQKLFNYLSNECGFTALQSQMQDIEDIVKEMIKPTETVEPKTYTLEDMEDSFFAGRIFPPRIMTGIKSYDCSFTDYIKSLK